MHLKLNLSLSAIFMIAAAMIGGTAAATGENCGLTSAGGAFAESAADSDFIHDGQHHAKGAQNIQRNFYDYVAILGEGFARRLYANHGNPNFHWIDVGSGVGLAPIESYAIPNDSRYRDFVRESMRLPQALASTFHVTGQYRTTMVSVEDLLSTLLDPWASEEFLLDRAPHVETDADSQIKWVILTSAEWRFARSLLNSPTLTDRLNSMTGRRFEDIPDASLGDADEISEVYGAFSYSKYKFEILAKDARLLTKRHGWGTIHTREVRILQAGGPREGIVLSQFLTDHPVTGLKVLTTSLKHDTVDLQIHPEGPETARELEDLATHMHYDRVEDTGKPPPRFFYRFEP